MTFKALYPTALPSLNLDFANTKQLDRRVTFTRASTATYVGVDGLIKTAASGVARFDHSATGESLGLLVEEARTNYRLNSAISSSTYGSYLSKATIVAANAIAPDGTASAISIANNTGYDDNYCWGFFNDYASIPTTGFLCASLFVKMISGTQISVKGDVSNQGWVGFAGININFATSTPTVTLLGASGQNAIAGAVIPYGNGWWRAWFVVNTADGFNSGATKGPGVVPYYAGTSAYIWGAQIEAGSFPTSYIPTVASTVTRAAEVATLSNTGSSIFPTSAFTTVNSPFGTAGGGTSFKLVGPTIKRTAVYAGDLTQAQINALAEVNDNFWRWRVLGSTFALPNFTTDGSVTVDWGDGVVETLTTAAHTFTNGGGYHDIGFRLNSGTFFKPYINDNATYKNRVIAVGPAPVSMKVDANAGLRGCGLLKAFDATVDVTGGTDFYYAWQNCSSLVAFPLINTGAATSFFGAWEACSSLTSFPLLSAASVTSFSYAWSGCNGLTSFPLISTGAGTNFTATWKNCSALTSFPLINTGAATNLSAAWEGCSSLTSFPLINTAAVTNFAQAWIGCSSLTSFPAISTSASTSFYRTWESCSSLTSFPSISMNSMKDCYRGWYGCSNLANFPANMFDTTGTFLSYAFTEAFRNCALTAASIENILTSLVTNNQSGFTLDMNGGTNANTSTWSAAANNAYLSLKLKGWTITQNGTAPVPPLDLQFAATKTMDSRITFTRSSSGTYVDSAGVIQTAANNVARFDHNPATLESLGLLVEEARTNILQYSEQFDNAYWTNVGLTWTANNVVAPDGLTTADTPSSNNITQVVGVYVNSTFVGQSTSSVTTSWNRVSVTFTTDASTTSINLYPLLNAGSNIYNAKTVTVSANTTYTFSCFYRLSGSTIIPWGAQLEAGAFPTSYIPTTTATVTRAADVASITGSNFSNWYNQSEGTLFANARSLGSSSNNFLAGLDSTSAFVFADILESSSSVRLSVYGTNDTPIFSYWASTSGALAGSTRKAAIAIKSGNFGAALNGIASATGTDTTGYPTFNRLSIMSLANYGGANGTMARLTYYPFRLGNTALQSLTT